MIGRIIVIGFALIAAILAAGIVLAVGVLAPDWPSLDSDPVERVVFFTVSFFATSFVGAVAFLPTLILVVVGEAMRFRSILYYGFAGAAVGLASYFGSNVELQLENTTDITPVMHPLELAAAAGIIGGLVYWLIAGRTAGRAREMNAL